MPIDSSIALGIRPRKIELQDPLEQYGRAMQLKSLLGQQQLQGVQLEQAQRANESDKNLRQLFAGMQPGEDISSKLPQAYAIDPARAMAIQKNVLEQKKTTAELTKTQLEAESKAMDLHRQQLGDVTTPQAAAEWVKSGYADPVLGPVAQRYGGPLEVALQRIPQDPQKFEEWRQQNSMGLDKLITHRQAAATLAENQRHHGVIEHVETVRADPFGVLGLNKNPSQAATAGAGLTGDEYLKTLPPGVAAQVKAMAEGKVQITPRTLQSPQGAAILQMAMQYEPGTDQTVYASRYATARDAASGKLAASNNALNTVTGHLAGLLDSAEKLKNTSFPWANTVKNAVLTNMGDPRVKEFNLNMIGVANELERAYRGAGGSESDIKLWRESLTSASSPEQFRGVMAKGAEMLQSKLEANQAQYVQGMHGKPGDYQSITPKSAAALAKLKGVQQTQEKAAAPQSFNSLPDPAKFDGKFMTDTSTNTRYKSVGGKWVRQ